MMGVMRRHGKPLTQTAITKTGILSLEFAKTKQKADEVATTWINAALQKHAVQNTYIDFIFIFFYSLFLFTANWFFSIKQNSFFKKTSQTIALFGLTAGLLDVVENFYLLKMLHLNISNAEANFTWWLAAVKFLLAAIAVLWIFINLVLLIIPKPKTLST